MSKGIKDILFLVLLLFAYACDGKQEVFVYYMNDVSKVEVDASILISDSVDIPDNRYEDVVVINGDYEIIKPSYLEEICGEYLIVIKSLRQDAVVTKITLYVDEKIQSTTYHQYNNYFTIPLSASPLEEGIHDLRLDIYSSENNYTTMRTKISSLQNSKCDNPPDVFITEPLDNSYKSGSFIVRAKAMDDSGVVGVSFYIDNNLLYYDTATPYEVTIDTSNFGAGYHRIKAVAFDSVGKKGVNEISVFFDTGTPLIDVISPADNSRLDDTLNLVVEVYDDVKVGYLKAALINDVTGYKYELNTDKNDNPIRQTINIKNIQEGFYILRVELFDEAGNKVSKDVRITIAHGAIMDILSCDSAYTVCEDISKNPHRGVIYIRSRLSTPFQNADADISLFKTEIGKAGDLALDIRSYYDGLYDIVSRVSYKGFVVYDLRRVTIISCDQDRDGFLDVAEECGGNDCDDRRHSINPGMPDFAGDGIDNNCDGVDGTDIDGDGHISILSGGDDCDDNNKDIHPGAEDIFGDDIDSNCDGADGIDNDGDGYPSNTDIRFYRDCDDNNPDINPGVYDIVGDGIDNNCDGVDGEDHDRDGFASINSGGADCDDFDKSIYPGAYDYYGNGIDENCDGADGIDKDGDGFPSNAPYYSVYLDCDDNDPSIHPGAVDMYGDGIDQDCDTRDGVDYDRDGFASVESGGKDCNDRNSSIKPLAFDTVGDGIDNNCDGIDGVDSDGDGYASVASGGNDCDDFNRLINPGMPDIYGDRIDSNCDGIDGVDRDGDGYASVESGGRDCDDNDPSAFPVDCFNKCAGYTSTCGDICQDGCISGYRCIENTCLSNVCPEVLASQSGAIYPMIGYCSSVSMVSPYIGPERFKQLNTIKFSDNTLSPRKNLDISVVIDANANIYVPLNYDTIYGLVVYDRKFKQKYLSFEFGPVSSVPAIAKDGTVYFASYNGYLYALGRDYKLKWIFRTNSNITTSPVIGPSGDIYITSSDRSLYRVSGSGAYVWDFVTEHYSYGQHLVDNEENIYLYGNGYYIYKVDKDGRQIFKYKTQTNTMKVALDENKNLYFIDSSYGDLVCVSSSGEELFRYPKLVSGYYKNYLIYFDKRIFVVSRDKYVLFDTENKTPVYSKPYTFSGYGDYMMPVIDASGYAYLPRGCNIEKIHIPTGESVLIYMAKYYEDCSSSLYPPVLTPDRTLLVLSDRGKLLIVGDNK